MTNRFWRSAALSLGFFVALLWSGQSVARAQGLPPDAMRLTVRTGQDDLRSDSSRVFVRFQHPDGNWSTEVDFSNWPYGLSGGSTFTKDISGWDGVDPCALNVQLRLQQGSCFLCGEDNWDIAAFTVDFVSAVSGVSRRVASFGNVRLTGSFSTIGEAAIPPLPGFTCYRNQTVDCGGNLFDSAVLTATPPFDQDSVCDNGASGTGFNFMCEAFLFDSGACGVPSGWPAACAGFYGDGICDCNDCGGVWDPDCNNPNLMVFDCSPGATCMNQQTLPGVYAPTCVTTPR